MGKLVIEQQQKFNLRRDLRSILGRIISADLCYFVGQKPKVKGIEGAIQDIMNHLDRHYSETKESEETVTISKHELERLKVRNQRWEELSEEVGQYYETEDDNFDPVPPKKVGDLGDIGLIAATKLGYI